MAKPFSDPVLDQKFKELKSALESFQKVMQLDLSSYSDEVEVDAIKNGQIQKFEYCLELSWKFLKSYLRIEQGIDSQGPKDVIRQFSQFKLYSADEISHFLTMIDDRNCVAHEYKDYIMSVVYPRLEGYLDILKKLLDSDLFQ